MVDLVTWLFREKHAIFADTGIGLNLFHILIDSLHILDLGVAQHLGGSILLPVGILLWLTRLV